MIETTDPTKGNIVFIFWLTGIINTLDVFIDSTKSKSRLSNNK